MRPTGALHLGHLCGALANWRKLQETRDCFFFVADWHALTTEYARPLDLAEQSRETIAEWIAAGIDPAEATLFVQSDVPAHAELFTLLSMLCPLPWLERVPTYREQIEQLGELRELATYGFLGYPLLQAADILIYRAHEVPVGEDQAPHVEFARDIAKRFNYIYGAAVDSLGPTLKEYERDKKIEAKRQAFLERGDREALNAALNEIDNFKDMTEEQREKYRAWVQSRGVEILTPPVARLTPTPRLPGTDGRKMSKSYDNAVNLMEAAPFLEEKLLRMVTDPARKRRKDPGDPDKCPVFQIHKAFSDSETLAWVDSGCRSADIGCVDCKKALAKHVNECLDPIRDRRYKLKDDELSDILSVGAKKAREIAEETMVKVRQAMRISEQPKSDKFVVQQEN